MVLVAVGAAVLVNGYLTQRYAAQVEAFNDLSTLGQFLAEYATSHDDRLPASWQALVSEGYVASHPKAPAQLVPPGNAIFHPERLRWVPNARLTDYVLSDWGVLDKETSQAARIIWLADVDPSLSHERFCNELLLKVWIAEKSKSGASGSASRSTATRPVGPDRKTEAHGAAGLSGRGRPSGPEH